MATCRSAADGGLGEYACADPHPPACIAATEGIDSEGLTSLRWLAWKVAIRFDPDHVGRPVRVRWKGWTSKDLVAVELLGICRNHDEPNVRELGSFDPELSDDDIVFAGAPGEIEVTVGGATYRYRLERGRGTRAASCRPTRRHPGTTFAETWQLSLHGLQQDVDTL